MTDEKNTRLLESKDTFIELSREQFQDWGDDQVLAELSGLEIMLDTDEINECFLVDIIIEMADALRDECIRRFHESVTGRH